MTAALKAFVCQRCGHCCSGEGGIVLTARDQARLAAHLGLDLERFLATYALRSGAKIQLACNDQGACVFFDQGCGVHPARPDICRAWPFFRGNLLDRESWTMIQEYCPGVNPEAGFEEFVRQGIAYLRENDLVHDGDDDAPSALRIHGVPIPGKPEP
ncbi:YkgJ family cysteine cluster protein [Fundidesulfovibrio butyratiphilus]